MYRPPHLEAILTEPEQLSWINCNEQGGWNGNTARDYNLYATPTMFIMDKTRKIIAKPVTFGEFKREISRIEGEGVQKVKFF